MRDPVDSTSDDAAAGANEETQASRPGSSEVSPVDEDLTDLESFWEDNSLADLTTIFMALEAPESVDSMVFTPPSEAALSEMVEEVLNRLRESRVLGPARGNEAFMGAADSRVPGPMGEEANRLSTAADATDSRSASAFLPRALTRVLNTAIATGATFWSPLRNASRLLRDPAPATLGEAGESADTEGRFLLLDLIGPSQRAHIPDWIGPELTIARTTVPSDEAVYDVQVECRNTRSRADSLVVVLRDARQRCTFVELTPLSPSATFPPGIADAWDELDVSLVIAPKQS